MPPQTEPHLVAQPKTIGAGEIHTAIERLAAGIADRHAATTRLVLLGIANGGQVLARRLSVRLSELKPKIGARTGVLDISFHRDDLARNPIPKEYAPTHIPSDVNGATVIVVDDVLFSGRTVKAALDELFDHGRPTKVELAILVDRGGRRLPFAADYCGIVVTAEAAEKVVVVLDDKAPSRDVIRIETSRGSRNTAV